LAGTVGGVSSNCNTLKHTGPATYCNTLQHTATHYYNILQHTMKFYNTLGDVTGSGIGRNYRRRFIQLQHTETHWTSNILQHITTHCNTLKHTATATYYSTLLQHTTTHYDKLQHTWGCDEEWYWQQQSWAFHHTATYYNTPQHTATHCNTLQHTATHCNTLQHT